MSDQSEADGNELWNNLENYRAKLTAVIEPSRITPYLRQCKVLIHDDEEQIFNDPNLVTRRRKVGMLLDILQRTGCKGHIAFLESLELYYPELYLRITGQEPTRTFSVILDAGGESSLTQLLMVEVQKQQQVAICSNKQLQELTVELTQKDHHIKQLQVKLNELQKYQERFWKVREQCNNYSQELKSCKEENYKWAKDFATQSEEKNTALMRNRDLQLEIERLKHNLMLAEDGYKVERTHTMKLKHAMEQRPTQDVIWELQRENDLLKAKLQELAPPQKVDKVDKNKMYIQILEDDRRTALEEHQDLVNTIYNLHKGLRDVEELRDKYLEEKEVFEMRCVTLQKDSQMYRDRIEATLKQMQEVATERDQALRSREDLHRLHSQAVQQNDAYRKVIQEQGERCDELQFELFQQEEHLLTLQGQLKRARPPSGGLPLDVDDLSPRVSWETPELTIQKNNQESSNHRWSEKSRDPGRSCPKPTGVSSMARPEVGAALPEESLGPKSSKWRMKKGFEDYRRKRAIRLNKQEREQRKENWENVTGSENSDTDSSDREQTNEIRT
ncbi:caspase recruitment domain-containing protein 9 isoform X2 [Chiloscyllium punctatum]|uniref:caspase recruitment domain-containing protein 9 isoform X2 n=1 Tax=Chiloscyllium punctatum TaxID=137246 RepID=UPI003B6375A4